MKNLSTRSRITLLVLLVFLPAMALAVYNAFRERAGAEATARQDLKRIALLAAHQQEQIVEGARQTLIAMSQVLPALHRDRQACNAFLAGLLKNNTGLYHSMGLYGADGELFCNGLPWQGKVYGAGRRYFQLSIASLQFSIGEYQVGQVTRQQGINFGYPVIDASGKITAVAFVAMNLDRLNVIAAATPLPENGILTVLDGTGIILARHPARSGVVGQKLAAVRVRELVLSGTDGIFEEQGVDGIRKLFAYQAVTANPDGTVPIRVMVSLPLEAVFADANRGLAHTLVGLLAATLLVLAAARYGAERLILRSIRRLLDTADRVRAGDLTARTGFHQRRDELSQVGLALDEMAQALQQREKELKQAMQDLREQSITDPLTGLYNRRYLLELLPRELVRAGRNGTHIAVIMVDVDHFKRINDSFGHDAGDLALRAIGPLLKQSIRRSDIACRFGGEEFLLILPEATSEGAARRAEAIRAAIKLLNLIHLGRALGAITASLGVALYPDHASDADALLRSADESLYKAKDGGRDRVVISAAVDEGRQERTAET
jgi:diguanylate cyclase (GGDEF)-like protein